MVSERDVTKLNERRTMTRLTEYRVLCAALSFYILRSDSKDKDMAVKLLKKYRARMDSTFRGAQATRSKNASSHKEK